MKDLRMLIPVAVQCFVSGKLWATGYRQVQRMFNKEEKSFT